MTSSYAALTAPKAPEQSYNPLADLSKTVADELWERAMDLADVFMQGTPVDQRGLDEHTIWLILEKVALELSPQYWAEDPAAISDLYHLRNKFLPGQDHEPLKILARTYRAVQKNLPNPSLTPANPQFKARTEALR